MKRKFGIDAHRAGPFAGAGTAIHGPLRIHAAPGLRERLLEGLEGPGGLELDLDGVEDCDLAGLQVLLAAKKSAERRSKPFRCSGGRTTARDAFRAAGIGKHQWTMEVTDVRDDHDRG